MATFVLLFFLLAPAASDQHVTVHPGDDVTLPCEAGDVPILAVEWTRADLESEYVLLNIDGHLDTDQQHPSFTDRVELVDRELKDGDVSLILKNVSSRDTGTYECRVKPGGLTRTKRAIIDDEPVTVIYLEVTDPHVMTVHPGDDVTLPCEAGNLSIRAVEWTRPDLESPEYVLFYSNGHSDPTHQHPSFTDRVEPVDRELKDGDVSLILKNVSSRDSGTYECRVKPSGLRRTKRATLKTKLISTINLEVTAFSTEESTQLVWMVIRHLVVSLPYLLSTVLMVCEYRRRSTGRNQAVSMTTSPPNEDDEGQYDDAMAGVTTEHHF